MPDAVTYEEFVYGAAPYWDRLMTISRSTSGHYTDYGYGYGRHLQVITFPAVAIADSAGPVRPRFVQQSISNIVDAMLLEGLGTSTNPAPLRLASNGPYYHDARDNRTSLALDRFGAPTLIAHWVPAIGDHNATLIYRNQHSQPVRIITPRGAETEYFWTSFKLDSIRNNHSGQRIRFQYEPAYNQVERVWGDVAEVRNFLSALGHTDSTRLGPQSAQSPRTRFVHDARSRIIRAEGRDAIAAEYVYGVANLWDNLDTVKIGPRRIVYTYDEYGRVASVRDPEGNVVSNAYDLRNRVWRTIGAHADTTVYGYNEAALKVSVLDAKGQLYDLSYNALGWLVSRTDPNGLSDLYAYDLNGNLARRTNRRGQTTSFTYDVLNRLTSRNAAGSMTWYATHPHDRFTATSNPFSTDTIHFDIQGRDSLAVSVRSGFAYRTLRTYDARGRQVQQNVTSPVAAGAVSYGYNDTYDRLSSVSGPQGNINFLYNPLGQLSSTVYPPVTMTALDQTFSSIGALGSRYLDGFAEQLQQAYVQDDNGRVKERWNLNQNRMRSFLYNGARLGLWRDRESVSPQCWEDPHYGNVCEDPYLQIVRDGSTSWDKVGNPTQVQNWDAQNGTVSTNPVVDRNRLTSIWNMTIGYDDDGNVISRVSPTEDRHLYWDAIGQLDSVKIGGLVSAYQYDGWGRRVRKSTPSGVTNLIWDGDQVIVESDVSHNVLARYGLVGSQPMYLRRGSDVRYYVQQNVGSVAGMFNGSGSVTHTYQYYPFGERLGADTPETFHNPLRFAGQYFDQETGMYYMRARYYDPALMRFISEDPLGIAGGINPYVYAASDPINLGDPSGLMPIPWIDPCSIPGVCFRLGGIEANAQGHLWDGVLWPGSRGTNQQFRGTGFGSDNSSGGGGGGGAYASMATSSRPNEQTVHLPSRSFQQCFSENTAPVRNALGTARAQGAAIIGATVGGMGVVLRGQGNSMIRAAFAAGNPAGFAAEVGGNGISAIGATRYLVMGQFLITATVWTAASAVVGGATYALTSAAICYVNPNY